jgi:hypothetical protein
MTIASGTVTLPASSVQDTALSTYLQQASLAFQRSDLNTVQVINSDEQTINLGSGEIVLLNSSSIITVYLPTLFSSSVGAKFTIIRGSTVGTKVITITSAGGLIYNTQINQLYASTFSTATANYMTFVCVAAVNNQSAYDWIVYNGQNFSSGIFALSGTYYTASQSSLTHIYNNLTLTTPYSQYYNINATSAITITLPRITSTVGTLAQPLQSGVTSSYMTGQAITFRRTPTSNISVAHTLASYSFTNTYFNQLIYNTANSAITSWNTYSLTLVPMAYIKSQQTCAINTSTSTVTANFTITGSTTSTIATFNPTAITTQNASFSGTTMTLSASNANVAIGQIVTSNVSGVTAGCVITAGSGTSWTVSPSQGTLSSRSCNFYSPYMVSSTLYTGTGTGFFMSNPTALIYSGSNTLLYPTALNYTTVSGYFNVPNFTLNGSVQSIASSVWSFYPMTMIVGTNYDPQFGTNEGNDSIYPVLLGSVDNTCMVTNNLSSSAVPTIQVLNKSTNFTSTAIGLVVYAWFQQ